MSGERFVQLVEDQAHAARLPGAPSRVEGDPAGVSLDVVESLIERAKRDGAPLGALLELREGAPGLQVVRLRWTP